MIRSPSFSSFSVQCIAVVMKSGIILMYTNSGEWKVASPTWIARRIYNQPSNILNKSHLLMYSHWANQIGWHNLHGFVQQTFDMIPDLTPLVVEYCTSYCSYCFGGMHTTLYPNTKLNKKWNLTANWSEFDCSIAYYFWLDAWIILFGQEFK